MIRIKKYLGNVAQSLINENETYDYDVNVFLTHDEVVSAIINHSYDKIFLEESELIRKESLYDLTHLGIMYKVPVVVIFDEVPRTNKKYVGDLNSFDAAKIVPLDDYEYIPILTLDDILDAIRNESYQAILLDDSCFSMEQRQLFKALAREKDMQVIVFDGRDFDEQLSPEKDVVEPIGKIKYVGNVHPFDIEDISIGDYNYNPFLSTNDIALTIINDDYKAVFVDKNLLTMNELKALKTLGDLNNIQVIGYEDGKPDEILGCGENDLIWHNLPSFVLALENDVDSDDGSFTVSIDIDEFAKYLKRFGNTMSIKFRRE